MNPMVDLLLGESDQRRLRSLLAVAEPVPGCPVPSTEFLESVRCLVRGDALVARVTDPTGVVVASGCVPTRVSTSSAERRLSGIGVSRDVDRIVADGTMPVVRVNGMLRLTVRRRDGYSGQVEVERRRRPFEERDEAVLRMLTPVIERLLPGPPAPGSCADLTIQQLRVLRLVAEGLANTEIAHQLHVSPGTVRKHLEHIYRKLGVHSRSAAATAYRGS